MVPFHALPDWNTLRTGRAMSPACRRCYRRSRQSERILGARNQFVYLPPHLPSPPRYATFPRKRRHGGVMLHRWQGDLNVQIPPLWLQLCWS